MAESGIRAPTYDGVGDIESYFERLECYCELMKTKKEQKVAFLLCGLTASQYENLRDLVAPEIPKELDFETLVGKLKGHFGSVRNVRMERAKFRSVKRKDGESIAEFEVQLRNAVRHCGFTGTALDENLAEQFIVGLRHPAIERKLLENGSTLKISEAVQLANTFLLLENKGEAPSTSRYAQADSAGVARISKATFECYRCGRKGHKSNDKCKAFGKECRKCKEKGHFAGTKFCKAGKPNQEARPRGPQRNFDNNTRRRGQNQVTEREIQENSKSKEDTALANLFSVEENNDVNNVGVSPTCTARLADIDQFVFVIDSGSSANIVSISSYNRIKGQVNLKPTQKEFYAFGQFKALKLKGEFTAEIVVNNHKTSGIFYVFDGNPNVSNLLSISTAKALDLLKVHSVSGMSTNLDSEIKSRFPECFEGVGKLKDSKVKLHIDPNIEPVAQPVRRLPFEQQEDIIESVEGVASKWISFKTMDDRVGPWSGHEYDDIFNHVKSCGRYQILLYGLINLQVFPIASQFVGLVFATGTPGFHCVTDNVTCPAKQCCDECTSYVFDGPFTSTVSEWNLICDRAYLGATINSCFFAGMLIGSFVTGMLSDAWGRKKCLFFCNAIMIVAGVGSALVDCVSFCAFLRFMVGFGLVGCMLSLYIYGMELVGPQHRTAAGNVQHGCINVAGMLVTLLSYLNPSWRIFLIITTAPAILLLFFWKWIPESPRWLAAHDRVDEAVVAIQKYGAKDGGPVDVENLKRFLQEASSQQSKSHAGEKKYTPIDLMRTPKIRKWSLIVGYQWFTIALVTFGIMLFFSQLYGDIYLNYTIIMVATSLRVPVTWIVFLKFGRRVPHAVIIAIGGTSLLIILVVYKDVPLATTALSLFGYIVIDCNWTGVYLMTAELFPTILRNTAQGTGSTCARIGGMIAPYIAMMGQLPGLSIAFPSAIFGCAAVLAGILMYWIPETLYSPMHQTIKQTEAAEEDFGIPCCGRKPKSHHIESKM